MLTISVTKLEKTFGAQWRNAYGTHIYAELGSRVSFVGAHAEALRKQLVKPQEVRYCQCVPRSKWPWWAKLIALCEGRTFWEEVKDKGVGDTFHRMLGPISDGYKLLRGMLGYSMCGCNSRRNRWNAKYPYERGCC